MSRHGEVLIGIGADGITGGWVVAACWADGDALKEARGSGALLSPGDRRVRISRQESVASIAEMRAGSEAVVAIDVPLGLLEHGGARTCDVEARRLLGKRACTVFNPPARYMFEALDASTSKERWEVVQRLLGERREAFPGESIASVSKQTIGILDKVADADGYLKASPQAASWLFECHPELSFLRLNDEVPLFPKTKARGVLQRIDLIEGEFPGTIESLKEQPLAESVPLPDLLDAYAALWTALRVACGLVHPERDALGFDQNGDCPSIDGFPLRIVA